MGANTIKGAVSYCLKLITLLFSVHPPLLSSISQHIGNYEGCLMLIPSLTLSNSNSNSQIEKLEETFSCVEKMCEKNAK